MVEINKDNVSELWELYEEYKANFYRTHFTIEECSKFEDFVYTEVRQCSNCQRYILEEQLGHTELALQDCICEDCMQDGYGE